MPLKDMQVQEEKSALPAPTNGRATPPGLHVADGRVPRATVPRPVPRSARYDHPSLYLNRELSWLDFNWRVLYQAMDERWPLLERIRFASISASNLDEFFRKRVGGLKRQEAAGVRALSPDGRTPSEQLEQIRDAVLILYHTLQQTWEADLKRELSLRAGIHILNYDDLKEREQRNLQAYFRESIFPILTPLAVDPGHPFPFISNLSLSLAVVLRNPIRGSDHFARLKIPTKRGRWIPVEGRERTFVPIEQVIAQSVQQLFRGMEVVGTYMFRITRNADLKRNEEEADDLLAMISEELRERRFAPVVRLEVEHSMPEHIRFLLTKELGLESEDVYEVDGMLDLTDLSDLADIELPAHKFEPWEPIVPPRLAREGETEEESDFFAIIRKADLFVHHPYESFTASVQRFIETAAEDPQVLAIKLTLYRTSDNSPIVKALIRAADRGKLVAVLVEVKARFDEENNIEWGQMLEKAGVHVTYGLVGLKTHSKTVLVIREEHSGLRAYCHLGTGNYNNSTARLYTDVGYLTCVPEIGEDLVNLYHFLTGYAPDQTYNRLIVAPRSMRETWLEEIRREIEFQKKHGTGRIIAKCNGLDDPVVIQELYKASRAGVEIDLIIRGQCRLRPGLERFSETIRVRSIIGRFLEHSRIYYFHNNGSPRTYISSADWQRRNLEDRVETAIEITEPSIRRRLIQILELALQDNRLAWELRSDGHYVQRRPQDGEPELNLHDKLMRLAVQRAMSATEDV